MKMMNGLRLVARAAASARALTVLALACVLGSLAGTARAATLVSLNSAGTASGTNAGKVAGSELDALPTRRMHMVSADGRYVVFNSTNTDLVAGISIAPT